MKHVLLIASAILVLGGCSQPVVNAAQREPEYMSASDMNAVAQMGMIYSQMPPRIQAQIREDCDRALGRHRPRSLQLIVRHFFNPPNQSPELQRHRRQFCHSIEPRA